MRPFRAEIAPRHREALERHDLHRAGLAGAPDGTPLGAALHDLGDRQREVQRTRRRDPKIDFDLSLCLVADPADGRLHGLIYTEQDAWEALGRGKPEVEDLSWWPHADRPANVEAAVWTARRETWRRLLGPSGVPARGGRTAEITAPLPARLMDPVRATAVAALAPDWEARRHLVRPRPRPAGLGRAPSRAG